MEEYNKDKVIKTKDKMIENKSRMIEITDIKNHDFYFKNTCFIIIGGTFLINMLFECCL